MTRRDGPYWLHRAQCECAAGDRLRMRVAVLAYLMCVAAEVGLVLGRVDL